MALVMPYPNTPLNGQSGDATPINANFTAIAQAIQSFDGSQIAAGTIVASALNSTVNPITRDNLIIKNFVSSGCVWSTVSGLSGTMTGGTMFINGIMVTVNGVVSHTFTASQDTYIDIDYNGNIYYQGVSNGSAAPSLTANSVRVAKVVTSGSAITSSVQTGVDSLNNQIYPVKPDGYGNLLSWTPTWTNLVVSGSTVTAVYVEVGKLVFYRIAVVLGGGNVPSGPVSFTLPLTSTSYAGTSTLPRIGDAGYFITNSYRGTIVWVNTTTARFVVDKVDGTYSIDANISATIPNTFTNGSELHAQGFYEAA